LWGILVLAGATLGVLWFWPFQEWEMANRNASAMFTILVTIALLLSWVLLFSGYRWLVRLVILLAAVGVGAGALASVRDVKFSGDMRPTFVFQWDRPQDDVLEAHRKQVGEALAPAPIRLDSGKPTEFPEYRGRKRDGLVVGPALARDWHARPPRVIWRQPVGGGYSAFAVAGNVAVTLEQRRDEEAVVCYDIASGKERWRFGYPAFFKEKLGGEGPRATPTISHGDIFSLGATGRLLCLDGATGKVKWSTNVLEGNDNVLWGMAGSPLVYDQVVVVNPGVQKDTVAGRALVAFDRSSGKPVWSSGNRRAGYSSPMLATLAGKRQILLLDGQALGGFDAQTGKELWHFQWDETMNGINVAQPVVLEGDRIFISSGYGIGCALVQVSRAQDKWSVTELWKNKAMRCRFSNPVLYQGYLYGLDEGFLVCLDPATGQRQWKEGRYGHGQLLETGGLLVILSETGRLVLVEANPDAHVELSSFPALTGKTWNYLALMDGKAYIRNHLEMACYELAGQAVE
jgi:outer membrane protein assembly factor BamB